MKRLSARYLIGYTTEELWDILVGKFILVFDNNEEMETDYRATLYSSYFWDFHRLHPDTPLLPRHHVDYVLKGKSLNSGTHLKLLGLVFKDVIDKYGFDTPESRDHLVKMIYVITNKIYNDLQLRIEKYVVGIDILDFINVIEHPAVKPVLDTMHRTREDIDNSYDVLLDVLNNDPNLHRNAVARAVRSKATRTNQVLQCVGPRGFLTDIDSLIFPVPITRGYVKGIRRLHDSLIESRSAAKSLFFSEDPLQDAEYFARRLQLQTMVVERVHYGDCGSQEYLPWKIKPPEYEKGKLLFEGDLAFMEGKYYFDADAGQLKILSERDTHLYGKTVLLRSPVAGCQHPDPHGVCSTCLGVLSQNVPPNANIGHLAAATMTQKTTQSVLSTKHYDGSSEVDDIVLNEQGRRFFSIGADGSTYFLRKELKDKPPMLIFSSLEVSGISDIFLVESVDKINISRVSEIDIVGVQIDEGENSTILPISVSLNNRFAMLTKEFLEFARQYRWTIDERENFVFDMTYWDFTKPIMTLPKKHYNMSDHSHAVAQIIESRVKDITERSKRSSPASTLGELFDIVNVKLNVKLMLLEVIIYAAMIVSAKDDDYRLPKPHTDKGLGVTSVTMRHRSLSAQMAFEEQAITIKSPVSFFKLRRPDHVMDAFLKPYEVVQALKKKAPYK